MRRVLGNRSISRLLAAFPKEKQHFSPRTASTSSKNTKFLYDMGRQRYGLDDKNGSRASDVETFTRRVTNYYTLEEQGKDVFIGNHLSTARGAAVHAAYGGLIFSQALCAAEKTVAEAYKPHSTHAFFILNVDTRIPCEYRVRRLRDGKSFCTRTVEAVQNEKVCFCLQVSFHVVEPDSMLHEAKMPEAPPPEQCVTNRDFAIFTLEKVAAGEVTVTEMQRKRLEFQANYDPDGDLFEIRCVAPDTHMGISEIPPSSSSGAVYFWMKTQYPVTLDSERVHRYLVAFTSDSVLASGAYLPHLVNDFEMSMLFSLDHCMWFHEPNVRADEWLLYEIRSNKGKGSRGHCEGRMWTQDGRLVMTAVQEALVRSKGSVSKI